MQRRSLQIVARLCLVLGSTFAADALTPEATLACSGSPCSVGELLPASGAVPANLPGLEWVGYVGTASVSAARVEASGEVPVGVTLTGNVVTLDESLVAGSMYVVRGALECPSGGGWTSTVRRGDPEWTDAHRQRPHVRRVAEARQRDFVDPVRSRGRARERAVAARGAVTSSAIAHPLSARVAPDGRV